METEDANKIIADYMGRYEMDYSANRKKYFINYYDKSLDALVPVWEKLSGLEFEYPDLGKNVFSGKYCAKLYYFNGRDSVPCASGWRETIQVAACIATAKAIMELKCQN